MADDPIQPPERFADDLRAIYQADVCVSARVNDAVLNRARAHFSRPRSGSRSLMIRVGALGTAAAAVITLAIFVAKPRAEKSTSQVAVALSRDVKAQGAVDIVDALRVARAIRDQRIDAKQDDFNHDGAVDQRDVDAIAIAAVQLRGTQ